MTKSDYARGQSDTRPWGSWRVIASEESCGYALKHIVVEPGKRLSLQYHHHRSEHWIVVAGSGFATLGADDIRIERGSHVYVPKKTQHRLSNTGEVPLVLVELQYGDILDENDIVRIEDDFDRV